MLSEKNTISYLVYSDRWKKQLQQAGININILT